MCFGLRGSHKSLFNHSETAERSIDSGRDNGILEKMRSESTISTPWPGRWALCFGAFRDIRLDGRSANSLYRLPLGAH